MLPILPNSIYTRSPDFVKEEWDAMFAPDATVPASTVKGGWQGVLYSNLAIIDAVKSWDFFARQDFDMGSIDGGTSRIWCLAYAAGKFVVPCSPSAAFPRHSRVRPAGLTTVLGLGGGPK